jgi:hypothetical protein
MELCALKFKKADQAEEAVNKLITEKGDQNPWLHEVGIIQRPLVGRISIRATYRESREIREGDIASSLANAGKWTGYLVGLAGPMRAHPKAFRRDVDSEGRQLLEELHRQAEQGVGAAAE